MSINEATRFDWDRATGKTGLEPWATMAEEEAVEDVVNNPDHYNTGSIECIDAIQESMSSVAFKGGRMRETYAWAGGRVSNRMHERDRR